MPSEALSLQQNRIIIQQDPHCVSSSDPDTAASPPPVKTSWNSSFNKSSGPSGLSAVEIQIDALLWVWSLPPDGLERYGSTNTWVLFFASLFSSVYSNCFISETLLINSDVFSTLWTKQMTVMNSSRLSSRTTSLMVKTVRSDQTHSVIRSTW